MEVMRVILVFLQMLYLEFGVRDAMSVLSKTNLNSANLFRAATGFESVIYFSTNETSGSIFTFL